MQQNSYPLAFGSIIGGQNAREKGQDQNAHRERPAPDPVTEEQADAAKGSGRDIEGVQAHQEMETDFRAPAEQAVRDPHEDCRDEAVERRIDEPADQPRIEIRKEPVRAVVLNDAQRAGVRLLSSALQPLSEAVTGDGRIGVDRVDQLQEDPDHDHEGDPEFIRYAQYAL